jgi:hypothetical protein
MYIFSSLIDRIAEVGSKMLRRDLIPEFRNHNWPVDTIALGADDQIGFGLSGTFHDFLSAISNATSGTLYANTDGSVPGTSPLNVPTLCNEILAKRANRTLNRDIPLTNLGGGTVRRNFTVTDYTSNLDVVIVNENQDATVSLVSPGGQTLSGNAGALVSRDPYSHYFIFSVDQPLAGQWEVDITGTGLFMVDILTVTDLQISINGIISTAMKDANLPATNTPTVLPLGQPFKVIASLSSYGRPISDNTFTINGNVEYAGSSTSYIQTFKMVNNAGIYTGDLTIPTTAPAGSYTITLEVPTVSALHVIASIHQSVRIELFPHPSLLNPKTSLPADTPANRPLEATVIQWPSLCQTDYQMVGS